MTGNIPRPLVPGSPGPTEPPVVGLLPSSSSPSRSDSSGFDWSESRWGIGDIFLGLFVVVMVTILATLIGLALSEGAQVLTGNSVDTAADDDVVLAVMGILSMAGLQLSTFGWPVFVGSWKGRGFIRDFGFSFRWIDLVIGPAAGIAMMTAAGLAAYAASSIVGLEDQTEAGNTQFLTDAGPGLMRYVLLFFVVVGAPLSEELFFRGLSLRAIQKKAGKGVALAGSTALFTLPHFQGGSWQAVVVMFATIGTIGALLGLLALLTDRLGPGIVAHSAFNGLTALIALNLDKLESWAEAGNLGGVDLFEIFLGSRLCFV